MTSIQGYGSLSAWMNAFPTTTKTDTTSSSTSTSTCTTDDLGSMTISQIREVTDKMATDGKLDPMQFALMQVSGWMDPNPSNPSSGQSNSASYGGGIYNVASPSSTQTYDVTSTLQAAAEFAQSGGNTQGAAEYRNLLKAFESYGTQKQQSINATA